MLNAMNDKICVLLRVFCMLIALMCIAIAAYVEVNGLAAALTILAIFFGLVAIFGRSMFKW